MKNKIFVGLGIVIVIGIIMIAVLGFNVDVCYKGYNLIDVEIGKDFNIADIKTITDEVFQGKKIEIQKAGTYSDAVVLKVDDVNEEQLNNLNTKINEKYGIENKVEDIELNYISNYKLLDIVKLYAVPLIISTVIILGYMAIKFSKLGCVKILGQTGILLVLAEALYISIIAITRFPINRLVMSVGIIIYLLVLTALTGMYEKQINIKKQKQ